MRATALTKIRQSALLVFLMAAYPLSALSQDAGEAVSVEGLTERVRALEQEVLELEEQNAGLRMMLKEMEDNEVYIVVDTENHRLTLRQGDRVLRTVVVGTGSRQMVEDETGRNWYFETPLGSFTVLAKERNPV